MQTPGLEIDSEQGCWRLSGDWTLNTAGQALRLVHGKQLDGARLDASAVSALDTSGAQLLLNLLPEGIDSRQINQYVEGLAPRFMTLLVFLFEATHRPEEELESPGAMTALADQFADLGKRAKHALNEITSLAGFLGLVLERLLWTLPRPSKWRLTAWVFHIQRTGLDAVPIVGLLSFLVGGVIAFLGARVLSQFGAQVFAVEMVSYAFLREFGVLLAAILVAGRSGSAFTAQIGSMKGREEVDALRTIGVDPVVVLILPRLLALLVSLPLLAFLANLAGLAGGVLATWAFMDISPTLFYTRMVEYTPVSFLWLGLVKAPVFALIIAVIGCREGLKVAGSAESVGRHTTSSVVQSIFWVIVANALFAILFMELDL